MRAEMDVIVRLTACSVEVSDNYRFKQSPAKFLNLGIVMIVM